MRMERQSSVCFVYLAVVMIVAAYSALAPSCLASENASAPALSTMTGSGLYLKVRATAAMRMSKLKPGNIVEGSLSRDVYSADRKLFPAGSSVRLTVDHLEKRKRLKNDHWPWIAGIFTPRHENYPVFNSAAIGRETGQALLNVSLLSVSQMREVQSTAKKDKSVQSSSAEDGRTEVTPSKKQRTIPTLVLEAFSVDNSPWPSYAVDEAAPTGELVASETLPAGTRCKILLLGNVSASKSKPGDAVQARLLEPVLLNSKLVFPAGTLFRGKVLKTTPPRWLSRAGSLSLTFTELTLPNGASSPIAASIAGAELDARSHTRMDAEGGLHGERPGKAWMAMNIAFSAGISKEADDALQLVIEAIVSTATDASTAGTARIVSSCVSGVYMATRQGRDVVLPRFTEMDISLDRPFSTAPPSALESSTTVAVVKTGTAQ